VTANLWFHSGADRANLTVWFRSGATYNYENVKMVDVEDMIRATLDADSVGQAFAYIREKYKGNRL
jgi:hypothetical protein